MDELRKAREKRGWSRNRLATEAGIAHQAITNLEGGPGATRRSRPETTSVDVAVRLIEVLWPDLDLSDFVSTDLILAPRDKHAAAKLARRSV